MKTLLIITSILFLRSDVTEAQTFYANIQSPSPDFNNSYQLSIDNCDTLNIFTCPIPNNYYINYYDIAVDTSKTIYYVASDGRLFSRKSDDVSSCQYLGTFNNYITSLVSDIDGNIYASGIHTSIVGQLYMYNATSHTFTTIGDLPVNHYPVGDLFFYEGKLFMLATTPDGACILDINTINPSLSCCFMNVSTLPPLIGAFSLKSGAFSKAYVVSENSGFGSNLYEIDMVQKAISLPICTYSFSILGCASIYSHSPSISNISSCGTLPVELLNFNCKLVQNKVELYWETQSEINNDYFLIQRSKDGIIFETIGKQNGAPSSTKPARYLMYDYKYNSENYYRLVQVDLDGKSTLSKVIFIKVEQPKPLKILSNPTQNSLTVQINGGSNFIGELSMFDFSGRKLKSFTVGNGVQEINISSINRGTYILQLIAPNGLRYSERFLKD